MNKNSILLAIIIGFANLTHPMEETPLNSSLMDSQNDWKFIPSESSTKLIGAYSDTLGVYDTQSGKFLPQVQVLPTIVHDQGHVVTLPAENQSTVISQQSPTSQRFSSSSLQIQELPVGEFIYDRGYLGNLFDLPGCNAKSLDSLKQQYESWNDDVKKKTIQQNEYDKQFLNFALKSFGEGVFVDAFECFNRSQINRIDLDLGLALEGAYKAYLKKKIADYKKGTSHEDLDALKRFVIEQEVKKELANNTSLFFGPIKDQVKVEMIQRLTNGTIYGVALNNPENQKEYNRHMRKFNKTGRVGLLVISTIFVGWGMVTKILLTKKST